MLIKRNISSCSRRSFSSIPCAQSDMITLTIVRHGESTDNLKPLWAGWADAPLSVHGMNQAKALGVSLKDTHVDAIFASDLLRATWTAQQIERNQPTPKPPLTISNLLREQNFGQAEHKPFGGEGYIRGPGRTFRFDEGESLEDVRKRANEAIAKFIEPSLQMTRGRPPSSKHVVVVAHGIFNSEFIGALLARRRGQGALEWGYKGMTNTGWTRMEVGYTEEFSRVSTPHMDTNPDPGAVSPSSSPSEPPPREPEPYADSLPALNVRILCTDITKHLDGVVRQPGGIGRQGYDEKQGDIRKFFGGGGNSA